MENNRGFEKNKNIRIAVAMSGGVDSSVAAALLTEEYGKENVFGVTMRLFCYADKSDNPKACCNLEAINDAKAVCQKLGIKHYVIDFEKEFEKEVINNFIDEYKKGHTPNPCVRCNTIIKSQFLLEKAKGLGAEFLATGHYARAELAQINTDSKTDLHGIKKIEDWKLLKGVDTKKDQSYFLYGMTGEQLSHTLFPLGDMTKEKAREIAKKYDLKTADKTESQDICFIIASDTDYHGFLRSRIGTEIKGGDIVNKDGVVLGKHNGLVFYTIGQRKGLGIAAPQPLYVIGLDVKNNQVIVGEEKDLYRKEFEVRGVNWIAPSRCEAKKGLEVYVSVRYNMEPQKAMIYCLNNKTVRVVFEEPQRSTTPGQSAVFYATSQKLRGTSSGDEVLGGGIIV